MQNTAHLVFGIFGNATALFLFLAPMITFWRIIKSKSTEQFSGIPYVMTLMNCLLSAWGLCVGWLGLGV
nr:bidirectional sugar transporter sweet1 [Quercus suber]